MKIAYLSTGKAAKALSVTPDTVLKWIKSGKLDARRTAGGHYRIHPGEIERPQIESFPTVGSTIKPKSPQKPAKNALSIRRIRNAATNW